MRKNSEIHSPASSEDQERFINYGGFPFSSLEAALSIINFNFFVKNYF
jgi:hypothetical protein